MGSNRSHAYGKANMPDEALKDAKKCRPVPRLARSLLPGAGQARRGARAGLKRRADRRGSPH